MTRREFAGWMVASVAAIVAGSRVWRPFRLLVEEKGYTLADFRVGDEWVIIRSGALVTNAVGRISEVGLGFITVEWGVLGLAPGDYQMVVT